MAIQHQGVLTIWYKHRKMIYYLFTNLVKVYDA